MNFDSLERSLHTMRGAGNTQALIEAGRKTGCFVVMEHGAMADSLSRAHPDVKFTSIDQLHRLGNVQAVFDNSVILALLRQVRQPSH